MINQLEFFLADRGIYMLALMLMAVGVYGMISCGNYMKKLICMNIMQVAIIFFFLTFGQKDQATLPGHPGGGVRIGCLHQSAAACAHADGHRGQPRHDRGRVGAADEN